MQAMQSHNNAMRFEERFEENDNATWMGGNYNNNT